jgi:predicted nucleotide-binding protein
VLKNALDSVEEETRQAVSHLQQLEPPEPTMPAASRITGGEKVFIGHGRSPIWRELSDFLKDRLHLRVDEFNRESVAGIPTTDRLSNMLDDAAFAFVIMTAEDEQADGVMRARENVVHEAGLFQGCLGFGRTIILLEDSCNEFSNIRGLGHISFPKGNMKAAFEDIRHVLEREKLIGANQNKKNLKT